MSKVTIADVAKAAGVSIATVSRVLNANGKVRATTERKVYTAMKNLGYEFTQPIAPKITAQAGLVLVLVPNLNNPFYSSIIDGIYSSAQRQDLKCVIYQTGMPTHTLQELKELISITNASGLILLEPFADPNALAELNAIAPIVQCAEYNEKSNLSFVSIDDKAASKTIVNYIISKGRRRIALINGPLRFKYARLRQEGYLEALEEAHIAADSSLIANLPDISFDSAFSVVTQFLNSDNPPDAIFGISDILAAAALKAAKNANIPVPDVLGVAGFDNTYVSTICEPSLTTVNQPRFQLGFLACEVLSERIRDPYASPRRLVLNTELIIRNSI